MKDKILTLLETKFQGTRKDGLSILAGVLAMTANDEETAKKVVEALTADQVKSFITDYRKAADSEITKATKTAEENLRVKYNFVEKKPDGDDDKKKKPDGDDKTLDIEALIKKATDPLIKELADLKGDKVKATRRETFTKAIGNIPDNLKSLYLENFEKSTFDTDDDFNAYVTKTTETASKLAQDMANNSLAGISRPTIPSVDASDVSADMKSYVESKRKKS